MNTKRRLLSLMIMSLLAASANAANEVESVDTSQWICKFCAFEEAGLTGTVDLGLGYVSDDSYPFGDYTGLNEKGAFLIGNASLRMRGEDSNYWNIEALNLGLDSRSINVEGGAQGSYKITFSYDELAHYISDSTVTPYLGAGSDTLTLPGSWVRASTTGTMTDLSNSLHAQNLDTKRKRLGLGAALVTDGNWDYAVNYRHETREGTKAIAGSFFFSAAQLVMPVDYVTQQIDVAAIYTTEKLQAKLAYYGSLFNDNNTSLTWDNPYVATNIDTGQLALAPDNQFHQILGSLGYQISDATRVTTDIALGRMTQDDDYLPATTNTSLAAVTLPSNSLDGRVDTLNANIKLTSSLSPELRVAATYVYNDHDDKTPQLAYTWVSTDISTNTTTRTNLPYSFTKEAIKLNADYRFTATTKASVGFDNASEKRTYQEVSKADENTFWAKASARIPAMLEVSARAAHAERDITGYEVLPWLTPVENPLLRKYNMADRTRETGGLRVDLVGREDYSFGFGVDYANDDYTNSQVGLKESQDLTYSVDGSVVLTEKTHMFAFANHEQIDSKQAGSSAASYPDWIAENNDVVNTLGIGLKHVLIEDKLDVGLDYNTNKSVGELVMSAGTLAPPFPKLITKLSSIKLHANYKLDDNLSLNGSYIYEHYYSANWALDNVAADTISNVLTLGEQPPSYYESVVMVAMRYKF